MLKNKSFYGLLGIVIILITIAVYASTNPKTPNTLSIPTSTPKISVKNTPEGWKTYTSQNLGFALAYPSLMEIREHEDGTVTFVLLGPTQSKGTEMYDGISINFSNQSFEGDFKEFIEKEWKLKKEDEIYTEVGEIKESDIAVKKGLTYSVSSLGNFDLIFIPTSDNKYLQITMLVEDPKNQGFEEISKKILDSLAIK
ncbi:hypothetical protein A2961_00775 [Candidatus Woesebacteria bacterium RIFCSPLOWO2_01_FULL_39_21]|uniref:PsbP C-terminal domain-containing protein n=1 Tax=Candidatus Woesebacteria bacterium RIFCSPLOWO2_01_FULL_39_21 TaxID=1802519 RepID=A0A1F8BMB5_9BACT|nr:MAG: hypothetical protein A2691_02070 [Candidatus Woesebacteria bacterium RIFCSPHIGHO2_01_FULL_39_23]OGM65214.1 MAG: hypothetical protein A2961_00775 [Candidatus Woesebacteria bacterium RIFCSPLOWO2_01_FULL_39_21]